MAALSVGPGSAALLRVLGDELCQARMQRGWIRKDLQARLDSDISLQTLATYEMGTRGIGVVRLVALCEVLEVHPPALLARALHRVAVNTPIDGLHIDLRAAADDRRVELEPLRRWARVQLTNHTTQLISIQLNGQALERLAELCNLRPADLAVALRSLEIDAA